MGYSKEEALAEYLGIRDDEISKSWGSVFETSKGDYVVTEDINEAEDIAYESLETLIEECRDGYRCFNINVEDYIEEDRLEDYVRKDIETYAEDIENESASDSDLYINRLHEEMVDAGVMYETLDDTSEEDIENRVGNLTEEFIDYQIGLESITDRVVSMYGNGKELYDLLDYYKAVDEEAIIQYVINTDGVADILSSYDGKECYLPDGMLAYRVN